MTLGERVLSAIVGREVGILCIPQGIVHLPHAVEFFWLEDVDDEGVLIAVSVQLEESHLHQVIVEVVFFNHLIDDVRVLEYQIHQTAVAHTCGDVFVEGFFCVGRQFAAFHDGILVVHVPHIAL